MTAGEYVRILPGVKGDKFLWRQFRADIAGLIEVIVVLDDEEIILQPPDEMPPEAPALLIVNFATPCGCKLQVRYNKLFEIVDVSCLHMDWT